MYYALTYDYVPDVLERRAPLREKHLALAAEYHERGVLLLGGAWGDPLDGALLIFRIDDPATEAGTGEVERFVERDPYVREGLVTAWRIRPWQVVVGDAPGPAGS